MKKLIIPSLFILIFVFTSCDKIKHPDQRPPVVYHCIDTLHQVISTSNSTYANYRKVLVEDYTGHACPNCPRAAEYAESIINSHPNTVVVIANHVFDTYAQPNRDTTAETLRDDFRNDVSSEWSGNNYFKIPSLPNGLVNRLGNPNFAVAYTQWPSLVEGVLSQAQIARMDMKSYYDTLNHYLSVDVKTTFIKAYPNDVNVVILLTQDNMIANQRDNMASVAASDRDLSEPQIRLHYKFDHVVINVINGTPGQLVKAAPINVNDAATVSTSCYILNKCFGRPIVGNLYKPICVDDNYVNLVAFVYDVSTYAVLQVETMRIKPTK